MSSLVEGILKGDKRSISRAITIIDNGEKESSAIIQGIFKKTGKAKTIGFTGAAGAGKSTLIGKLATEFQNLGHTVGVLAVDPSSPITGGAILGDRVRMISTTNDHIYMRSLASRGAEGGISRSIQNVTRILDAAGYDIILIESVGAGQLEVEISRAVNLTVVLFTPHTGDSIQAVKAGLSEVGDLYVINKSDLDGSSALYSIILDFIGEERNKPVMKCSAKTGKGLKELAKSLHDLIRSGKYDDKKKDIIAHELQAMILNIIKQKTIAMIMNSKEYEKFIDQISKKEVDPFSAAMKFSQSLLRSGN